jgi:predicted nuclease of predicted toxin-antitoxin system
MRLLVDVNLTPRWVHFLRHAGYDAVHWSSVGPNREDSEICDYARQSVYVILTNDLDFPQLLAQRSRTVLASCSSVGNRSYQKYAVPRFSAPFKIVKRNSNRAPSSPSTGRTGRAPECCRCDNWRRPDGNFHDTVTCVLSRALRIRR